MSKTPNSEDKETIYEIKEIMDCLGRSHSEGFIKGTHLSTILSYLRQKKTETFRLTKAKLALICGMGQRYLQENYLDGIEAFGLIEMGINEYNEKIWKWIGLKALRNNSP